ncbi:hypothetical protein SBRY_40348 [Actinacidiphila bryophytorum]|uniref:Uncharacterized protein n=1 Tax=Actinacidiphila bryophytorum TaxID=1436133 RepID=A0A9W4H2S1_9ACTN|nr:hypothetical protein SBRY_40348 [Actinacidiphila bryophytorum]
MLSGHGGTLTSGEGERAGAAGAGAARGVRDRGAAHPWKSSDNTYYHGPGRRPTGSHRHGDGRPEARVALRCDT